MAFDKLSVEECFSGIAAKDLRKRLSSYEDSIDNTYMENTGMELPKTPRVLVQLLAQHILATTEASEKIVFMDYRSLGGMTAEMLRPLIASRADNVEFFSNLSTDEATSPESTMFVPMASKRFFFFDRQSIKPAAGYQSPPHTLGKSMFFSPTCEKLRSLFSRVTHLYCALPKNGATLKGANYYSSCLMLFSMFPNIKTLWLFSHAKLIESMRLNFDTERVVVSVKSTGQYQAPRSLYRITKISQ